MGPSVPPPRVKAVSLHCPNCGGPIQLRGFAFTLTAVCQQCLSILDATTPTLKIIGAVQAKMRRTPKIPLGSRGKLEGTAYEVIGFQTRAIEDDGETYEWDEYVLFNPYKGFIYLTEYQGHWNIIHIVRAVPEVIRRGRPVAMYRGQAYRHFQHSNAHTVFVLGEFPWRVHTGERVLIEDFTSPPQVLSSESTNNETTWSLGSYVYGKDIWNAFQLKDRPPAVRGPYVNQPNPNAGKPAAAWRLCMLLLVALVGLAMFFEVTSRHETVLNERHQFNATDKGEQSFVTPVFELKGHESNVVVDTRTNLMNEWIYMNYALINADTGKAYDFGREVSYYKDGGETEGGPNDSVTIPSVPAGRYYLRAEPEGDPKSSNYIQYDIVVHRDVPSILFFVLAAFALLIPPIVIGWRSYHFEYLRWQESSYPKVSSSS